MSWCHGGTLHCRRAGRDGQADEKGSVIELAGTVNRMAKEGMEAAYAEAG
jgi:hypothetical protein